MKHSLKQTLLGSGAIASLLLSASLVSCQDEDYGYTQEEIHQSYLDRKYAEEFAKAFPNADPNHTWMCAPDTFGVESLIGDAMTRAYDATKQITITKLNDKGKTTESEVQTILSTEKDNNGNYKGKLPEAQDNRGQVTQSFEYFAVNNDDGNGYQTYTVTPMFWGRKFCNANAVGIYYIDNDGEKQDLGTPFWNDQEKRGITVHYKDGFSEDVAISDQQIDEDPLWSNYAQHVKLEHKCGYCGIDIIAKDQKNGWRVNPTPVSDFAHKYIELTTEGAQNNYDTQLIIRTPNKTTWDNGDDFVLKLTYQVTGDVDLSDLYYEFQGEAGHTVCRNYTTPNEKYSNDDGTTNIISFEHYNEWSPWKTITITGKIPYKNNRNGDYKNEAIQGIAINLARNPGTTYKYRFSEISWNYKYNNDYNRNNHTNAGKQYCGGDGKFEIDHFELPQYQVKVPVGMKWGFYLKTKQQQKDANNYTQTWYSNSKFNEVTDKDQNHGFVSAAATYQVADPNNPSKAITYCCFEDAACRLHEYERDGEGNEIKQKYENNQLIWNEGNCHCGYGHYDTDYNDIILRIVSDPVVVSSYKSLKSRVMCEDLGGTWDWDFNDIVYDVEYSDAENENDPNAKATVKIKLQAVGGTLPVCMQFDNSNDPLYHISSMRVDNNSSNGAGTTRDLHTVLSVNKSNPQDNKTKLYLPVNVPEDGGQKTIEGESPQVVCTYTLNGRRFDDLDPRIFVDLIKIKVQQNPTSNNTTTTTVAFPTAKNPNGSKVPECFMTSISTPWPNEHQKVSDRFPGFDLWVKGNANNEKWWTEGFGGGTTEVVTQ